MLIGAGRRGAARLAGHAVSRACRNANGTLRPRLRDDWDGSTACAPHAESIRACREFGLVLARGEAHTCIAVRAAKLHQRDELGDASRFVLARHTRSKVAARRRRLRRVGWRRAQQRFATDNATVLL